MPTRIVLFADNTPIFLDTRAEFLENAGYRVLRASSVAEAKRVLDEAWVHLAVLDIRLSNDDDEKDSSGLMLAKQSEYRAIPKIILTGYPSYQQVRDVLGPVAEGLPPAVDFLAKVEGSAAMLDAVARAFTEHVRINWDLRIRSSPREPISLQYLLALLDPQLAPHLIGGQAEELGDVLRKLFYDAEQVTLQQLLWSCGGRVAVLAVAFSPDDMQRRVVVECGAREAMQDEAARHEKFARNIQNQGLTLEIAAETMHFSGRLYAATTGNLEGLQTFRDYYSKQPAKEISTVLEKLFTVSLAGWHNEPRLAQATESIAGLYRAKLGLEESTLATGIVQRLESLDRQARARGLGGLVSEADGLRIQFPKTTSGSLAHPMICLCDDALTGASMSVKVGTTIGALGVDSVLVGMESSAWPSDFGSLGLGPLLGDYAALETSIRFELLETTDLAERYAFEKLLTAPSWLNDRLEPESLPEDLAKAFAVIRRIRQQAASNCGIDIRPYYLGLLFYTAKRLLAVEPDVHFSRQELVPQVHAGMLLAMLCDRLNYLGHGKSLPSVGGVPTINEAAREVWVGSQKVDLSQGEYDLLLYLWKHPREVCSREALVQAVYKKRYKSDDDDPSLNMAVTRLRQKIEADPEHPQIILTKRGIGYMLNLHKE